MVDGDDFMAPEALRILNDAYEAYPQYDCIYSNHYICDVNGEVVRKALWISQYPIDGSMSKKTDKIGHLISFKKSAYILSGGYDRDRRHATDKQLISRLEEVCRFKFIDTPLYYYRRLRTREADVKARTLFNITVEQATLKESGVSIIISHSGSKRIHLLKKSLAAIEPKSLGNIEVILSLSNSDEDIELFNELSESNPDIKIINSEGIWTDSASAERSTKHTHPGIEGGKIYNIGRARNQGALKAYYRRLFFLDSDILIPNNFYDMCLQNIKYNQAWLPIVRNDDGASARTDDEGFRIGGFGMVGITKRDFYFVDKWNEMEGWGYEDNLFFHKLKVNQIAVVRERCKDFIHQFHEGADGINWSVPWEERKAFIDLKIKEYAKEIKLNNDETIDVSGNKIVKKSRPKPSKIKLWRGEQWEEHDTQWLRSSDIDKLGY